MASTTSDLALLGRKLGAFDYNPDIYVKEIAQRCVGGHELHLQRNNIKTLSEDTHSQLKKNVYQNYNQFIETAKEISFLESEMYQLSHMITEQRNLLTSLMETSILGDKIPLTAEPEEEVVPKVEEVTTKDDSNYSQFEEGRRLMFELFEKVEGCSHVTDVPSRYLIHDGDLVEMDITENSALHRVHGYLLNDGFMVAKWLPNRRGPVRFQYSCLYELDSLAVVNVRDLGGIKHAFKLLVFPETRLFQCANAPAKEVWMEKFELAKKIRQKQQDDLAFKRRDTMNRREMAMMSKGDSTESSNPFAEIEEEDEDGATGDFNGDDGESLDVAIPEWLAELPDDLEVLIAQREFEQAVDIVRRGTEFCSAHSDSALVREAKIRLDVKTKHLIEVLTEELRTDKSVQGGPRAARRAVQLLVKLGRSTKACDLFLQHRGAILNASLKSVKMETATVSYVQRQAVTFFTNVLETSHEFRKAFGNADDSSSKISSLLVWLNQEMDRFCDRVEKQMFTPSTPLETISVCVQFVRQQSVKMRDEANLDVVYLLDSRFRRNVERTICEHRDKHVEAVKMRAQEDKWEAINCYNKSGTERFLQGMSAAGLPSVRTFVYDECRISLTNNTTSFALSYLHLVDCLLKLYNPSLRALINESLVTVFHSHLRHIEQAVRSERLKKVDPKFIQGNAAFLLDTLLSLVEHKYHDCPKLSKLHASYNWLKDGSSKGPSTSNSATHTPPAVTKYTDPDYI